MSSRKPVVSDADPRAVDQGREPGAVVWHAGDMRTRHDQVDLEYRDRVLTGMLGRERVELPIDVPRGTGSARGCYGDAPVTASWHIASNCNASEQPASLEATFIDQSVALSTTIIFRDRWNPELILATILGNVGDDPVTVNVAPGLERSRMFCADGHVGTSRLAVIATVDGDRAMVGGIVDDQPARLDVTASGPAIRIKGRWPGPPSIALLMTTCLLYFL